MSANCWNLVKLLKVAAKINTNQSRSLAKTLYSANNVIPLNQHTLTGRMMMYLNVDKEKSMENVQDCLPALLDWTKFKDVMHSPDKKWTQLSISMKLHRLDGECCSRLDELDSKQLLKLLNTFMNVTPNRILNLKFYKLAVQELYKNSQNLDKTDLLLLIFYIGLQKKTSKAQAMLQKILKQMDDDFIKGLTTEELCIICNSTFKTSTKIAKVQFLEKVKQFLNDNLFILKDPALFITLIKTIRHNKYQDSDLLATISCGIFFNKTSDSYSFSALCHILAIYADFYYYDGPLIEYFTQKCLTILKETTYESKRIYMLEQPREKDITRFLWGLSNFRHFKHIDKEHVNEIVMPKLLERIEVGGFENDGGDLVEIMLYLWMLGCRPYELVPYVLCPENVQKIRAKPTKSKERLNLLLYSIYIEDRNFYHKLDLKPTQVPSFSTAYELQHRPLLKRILNCLKSSTSQMDLNKFEVTFEVPYINIAGITGFKKNIYKTVYIEVLDEQTCLKNVEENVPHGLMSFKLKLLDHSEEALITISKQEVDDMTEAQLQEYLIDEINLVC